MHAISAIVSGEIAMVKRLARSFADRPNLSLHIY